jgi:hypothetical protein
MTKEKEIKPAQEGVFRKRLIWLTISLTLIVVSLVVIFAINRTGNIEGVVIYEQQARGHNDALQIEPSDIPPVGGAHHSQWQACGVYSEAVDAAHAIHTLEHGAVWITYDPGLPAGQIADLQALAGSQDFLLLSPYPGQQSPIVLTAWGVQLEVQESDDGRIPAFISRYRLGPTTPERGAAC